MGEEIIMSARLWTAGYDIFAPSQAVVGHMYHRKHQPKFWETVRFTCCCCMPEIEETLEFETN